MFILDKGIKKSLIYKKGNSKDFKDNNARKHLKNVIFTGDNKIYCLKVLWDVTDNNVRLPIKRKWMRS